MQWIVYCNQFLCMRVIVAVDVVILFHRSTQNESLCRHFQNIKNLRWAHEASSYERTNE